MSVFNSMKINVSGLSLERLKMDTINTNIANMRTTRTEEGGPYKRKQVLFEESLKNIRNITTDGSYYTRSDIKIEKNGFITNAGTGFKSFGVRVTGIEEDGEENFKREYKPDHPDADENGYVLMPNINMVDEMIDLIKAQRAYEANLTAFNTSKNIYKKTLEITKG